MIGEKLPTPWILGNNLAAIKNTAMVFLQTIKRLFAAAFVLAAGLQVQGSDASSNSWSIATEPDWVGLASSQTITVPKQQENTGQFFILFDQQINLAREERYTQVIKK